MMTKHAIVNSSPLIFLSKAGYLDLLKLAGDEIFVPDAVILEINRRGASDVTVRALQQANWLQVVEVKPQSLVQAWDLGLGETAVLSYALHKQGVKAVIDDGLARKCAQTFEIPLLGMLGLVLLAKKRGLIVEARPIVRELKQQGMYLKEATLNQALALVGE
jgi:predicted nucleic acid-binding protein